jgi:hypothetical protein
MEVLGGACPPPEPDVHLPDDPTSRAVDELNRRLVRAHRRMAASTVLGALAAGAAGVAGLVGAAGADHFTVRDAGPVFLFSLAAGFAACTFLFRRLLGRLRRRWILQLADEAGVVPGEVAGFALPFGGPPERAKGADSARSYRTAAIAFAASGGLWALGMLLDLAPLATAGGVATSLVFMVTFRRYLGYRPPG